MARKRAKEGAGGATEPRRDLLADDGAPGLSERELSELVRDARAISHPYRVDGSERVRLADFDPADTGDRRLPVVSRNDRRGEADPAKEAGLLATEAAAVTESEQLSDSDPRDIARALMGDFGFSQDQFSCLDSLWIRESNWNPLAHNPSSGAHGIPQALPGDKMAVFGSDWETNPVTQIKWGLDYIRKRYGTPCDAWSFWQSHHWY